MDRLFRSASAGIAGDDNPKDSMIISEGMVVEIETAEYMGDYKLHLRFTDGHERVIDFGSFLLNSSNPLIRNYLDLEKFKQFTLEYGDLTWNDYDLCFPIADLYEGRI